MRVSLHGFIPYLRLMQFLSLLLYAKSISPQPAWPQIVISLMLLIVVNYGLNKSCCTQREKKREAKRERQAQTPLLRIFHVRALRNYHVIINERVFILYLRLELLGSLNRFPKWRRGNNRGSCGTRGDEVWSEDLTLLAWFVCLVLFSRSAAFACIGFLCKLQVLCLCCCSRLDIRVVVTAADVDVVAVNI